MKDPPRCSLERERAPQFAHATDPAIVVAGLFLYVVCDLRMRQDHESAFACLLDNHVGNILSRKDAVYIITAKTTFRRAGVIFHPDQSRCNRLRTDPGLRDQGRRDRLRRVSDRRTQGGVLSGRLESRGKIRNGIDDRYLWLGPTGVGLHSERGSV